MLSSTGPHTGSHPCQPAAIHPLLWRGSQVVRSGRPGLDTGHAALSRQLPDGGWPPGSLTELLLSQPGIGELRLLMPALRKLSATRPVVLLQPPQLPCAAGWLAHGFASGQLLWVQPATPADALWSAEQILKSGSCGALLHWHARPRPTELRRLHLAAQAADTLYFMFRHIDDARLSSPAPLRLALQPAGEHLRVDILKRRGAPLETSLLLPLAGQVNAIGRDVFRDAIFPEQAHARMDSHTPKQPEPRRAEPVL
jgi:protein ImuA